MCRYRSQNALNISEYIMVPKPNDAEPLRFEKSGARCVTLETVVPTIDLDNELDIKTDKISYVRRNRNLPPEFCLENLSVSELRPQQGFCFGGVAAQVARPLLQMSIHPSPSPGRSATTLSRKGRGYKAMIA